MYVSSYDDDNTYIGIVFHEFMDEMASTLKETYGKHFLQ